jgi:hypothetical protein
MQLITVRNMVIWCCFGARLALPWAESASLAGLRDIEITRADLFSVRQWDSGQVRVVGLRLGMPREEANSVVRSEGLQLMQYGPPYSNLAPCSDYSFCFLAGKIKYKDEGLMVVFSETGKIIKLDVELDMEVRGSLLGRFKGETYRFFNVPYSDGVRLKLFGPETVVERTGGRYGDKFKDTNYVYRRRGLILTVSPRPGVSSHSGDTRPVELTNVSFVPSEQASQ